MSAALRLRTLLRGAGVGCMGGASGGVLLFVPYIFLFHEGKTLYPGGQGLPIVFGILGGLLGLVVGPVVFAIDRRGGDVGGRRSGLWAVLGALVVGGTLEVLQALATGRWRQPGFFTTVLVFVVGGAAASAGAFAKARRQRHIWSGGQDLP